MSRDLLLGLAAAMLGGFLVVRACSQPPEPEPTSASDAEAPGSDAATEQGDGEAESAPAAEPPTDSSTPEDSPPSSPELEDFLGVRRLGPGDALPRGPAAAAQEGDFLLHSSRGVRFFVSDVAHRVGFQETGGNLVDIVVDGQEDVFDGMSTFFDRTFPRQGAYDTAESDGTSVTVSGLDSGASDLRVRTTWRLIPEGDDAVLGRLAVTTAVTNDGDEPVADYELGDIIGWGGLRHFAPGLGWEPAGEDAIVPWAGGETATHAVLVATEAPFDGPHGASWTDPVYSTVSLAPGETASFTRQVLVGRSLGELAPLADRLLGAASGEVAIKAVQGGSQQLIPEVTVLIQRLEPNGDHRPWLSGRTGADGWFRTRLRVGTYRLVTSSPSRHSVSEGRVEIHEGGSHEAATLISGPGRLALRATTPDGEEVPARFDILGRGSTANPDFGSPARAVGGHRAYLAGPTELPVPPGSYEVRVTHGPTWSTAVQEVRVPALQPGEPAPRIDAVIRPVLDSEGWRQCDLHQHAVYSADSSVPPVEGILASAIEGLDCIATTDHDAVADWTQHFADSGFADDMLWLPGIEVTTQAQGHFNAFPWAPSLGTVDHFGRTAVEVTSELRARAPEAVVQLNHPMWGKIGLFELTGRDDVTGLMRALDDSGQPTGATDDFDAVEVLNGKDSDFALEVLQTWLTMVDSGQRATLVGSSDSHRLLGQERGSARTWVPTGGVAGTEPVVTALRETRRATASTGPFLDIEAGEPTALAEAPVRVTVRAPEWMALDRVEIVGGDPLGAGTWTLGKWRPGSPGLQETIEDGLRTWTVDVDVPLGGVDGWVVALARGEEPMEPWSEGKALAVTNPLFLSEEP